MKTGFTIEYQLHRTTTPYYSIHDVTWLLLLHCNLLRMYNNNRQFPGSHAIDINI